MRVAPVFLSCALLLAGCSGIYYDAMEKVGIPKRKILVDRVEAARGAQQEAKQQFASALARALKTRPRAGCLRSHHSVFESTRRFVADCMDTAESTREKSVVPLPGKHRLFGCDRRAAVGGIVG